MKHRRTMKYSKKYSKNRKSQRRRSRRQQRKSYYGGTSLVSAKPFQMYGLPSGATSMREAAIIKQQNMNKTQQSLIDLYGGKRHKIHKSRKNKKGGSKSIIVPSFSQGSDISPNNPTNLSISGNQTSLQALANSSGDCWATNSCKGGMRRRKRGGFQNWYNAFPSLT